MLIDILGFLAAFTSTISLWPQIYKTNCLKSATDLSYLMLGNFILTSVLWVSYGVLISSKAVWVANVIMLISSIWLLWLKYRYNK